MKGNTMMTDMEQDYAGQIVQFAFDNYKDQLIEQKELICLFWDQYLDRMGYETGLEMPHEHHVYTDNDSNVIYFS